MKLSYLSAASASLCLLAASAQAQDAYGSMDNIHQGFYLNGNIGFQAGSTSHIGAEPDDVQLTWGSNGLGGGGYAGYMFTSHVGLEAGGYSFSNSNLLLPGSITQIVYGVTVVGNLPLGQRFSVFGKAGAGAIYTHASSITIGSLSLPEISHTYGAALLGAGLSYSFSKHLSTNIQFNSAIPMQMELQGVIGFPSIGLTWHFS